MAQKTPEQRERELALAERNQDLREYRYGPRGNFFAPEQFSRAGANQSPLQSGGISGGQAVRQAMSFPSPYQMPSMLDLPVNIPQTQAVQAQIISPLEDIEQTLDGTTEEYYNTIDLLNSISKEAAGSGFDITKPDPLSPEQRDLSRQYYDYLSTAKSLGNALKEGRGIQNKLLDAQIKGQIAPIATGVEGPTSAAYAQLNMASAEVDPIVTEHNSRVKTLFDKGAIQEAEQEYQTTLRALENRAVDAELAGNMREAERLRNQKNLLVKSKYDATKDKELGFKYWAGKQKYKLPSQEEILDRRRRIELLARGRGLDQLKLLGLNVVNEIDASGNPILRVTDKQGRTEVYNVGTGSPEYIAVINGLLNNIEGEKQVSMEQLNKLGEYRLPQEDDYQVAPRTEYIQATMPDNYFELLAEDANSNIVNEKGKQIPYKKFLDNIVGGFVNVQSIKGTKTSDAGAIDEEQTLTTQPGMEEIVSYEVVDSNDYPEFMGFGEFRPRRAVKVTTSSGAEKIITDVNELRQLRRTRIPSEANILRPSPNSFYGSNSTPSAALSGGDFFAVSNSQATKKPINSRFQRK